jgi:hypothetical protein
MKRENRSYRELSVSVLSCLKEATLAKESQEFTSAEFERHAGHAILGIRERVKGASQLVIILQLIGQGCLFLTTENRHWQLPSAD